MDIRDIKIPLVLVASLLVFTIGSVVTIEFRYVKAEDLKQFVYRQAIRDDRQSLEILEQKLEDSESAEEKQRIERQIDRTEKSLYINMEKIE